VLQGIVNNPDQRIGDLLLLTKREKQQLLRWTNAFMRCLRNRWRGPLMP
jgi:hypothetical protein